jgi:POT family proton-dependent oligopeptide transporter
VNSITSATETATANERVAHPRGLYTLFFTEMWERFSYYGMRALLVLFMVDAVRGGLGITDEKATAIYGLYTAGVYLAALPGGWLADRIFGARRAVWYGGIIIAAGHFVLAIPGAQAFYLGLILVVTGTGLLKPNISAMVGRLYPEGGARRDAGFTIFYMGINLGAAIGPMICSTLGERVNWHYGFGAAGVGMTLGLIQYHFTQKRLGTAGLLQETKPLNNLARIGLLAVGIAVVALIALCLAGVFKLDPVAIAKSSSIVIVSLAALYFVSLYLFGHLDKTEKKRVAVIIVLFIASALFWAGFEQSGSSFNLFAERFTRHVFFGREIPAGWFQSLGPIMIISLAPLFALLWVRLAARHLEPSLPVKFAFGLILLGAGFAVMGFASKIVAGGHKVWPTWLIATYLLHTFGELCLSPVGLSSVTKLAPARLTGQLMGTWFLATSLGNLIAGLLAGQLKVDALNQMPGQYLKMVWLPLAAGILLILLARPIKRLMAGIR